MVSPGCPEQLGARHSVLRPFVLHRSYRWTFPDLTSYTRVSASRRDVTMRLAVNAVLLVWVLRLGLGDDCDWVPDDCVPSYLVCDDLDFVPNCVCEIYDLRLETSAWISDRCRMFFAGTKCLENFNIVHFLNIRRA